MSKVFPNVPLLDDSCVNNNGDPIVLTVWKKSLLFNCEGFTVFDSRGNLVYRVDNYIAGNKAEIVLMDAHGNSLLTIRRKKMSLGDRWLVFNKETADHPRFLVKKNVNILKNKSLAQVVSFEKMLPYEIEGSYGQRCCVVYDDKRRRVAEIKQKESLIKGVAFGMDIFRLIVHPGFDMEVAMAFVIVLDQMFGSR